MAEHGTTPVPVRGLRLLKGDTAAGDTAPGTEGDTQGDTMGDTAPIPVSAPDAVAVPLSLPERVRLAVAHWAGTAAGWAGQLWLRPDRVIHALWHGRPASMAEHRAYMKSRAWVPGELAGNPATVIAWAGILYHLLIARPLKAVARTTDAAADRPLRLLMLIVFVLILLHL